MASPAELLTRVKALRLPFKRLADVAGVNENTVSRCLKKGQGTLATLDKIERGVAAEEARLRRTLGQGHAQAAE